MSSISRYRQVEANQTVLDQADVFQGDGFNRVSNVVIGSLTLKVFWNNATQPWTLADGAGIQDPQVAAGYVYWNEIPGSPGYYGVRFRPSGTGHWRLVLTYGSGSQVNQLDYDVVVSPTAVTETGLRASFFKL